MLFKHFKPLLFCACLLTPSLYAGENKTAKLEKVFSRFLQRTLTIESTRWIFFPFKLAGTNVKVWESPGLLMGEAPHATATVSLKTITSGRLRVADMRFKNAVLYLRFKHDGTVNLVSMIQDLSAFARKNYQPGQKQKVAYNLFRIENAKMEVIDAETGHKPFGEAFVINGQGDVNGLGPRTQFPFQLNATLPTDPSTMKVDVAGTVSIRPQVQVKVRRAPLSALADYLPVVRWFDGTVNAEFDFSKAGAYKFWKLHVAADKIKTKANLAFPLISVDGFFHPFAPSTLKATLEGERARVDIVGNVVDVLTKKATLSLQSRDADIHECIEWCRTGYLISRGLSEPEFRAEMKKSLAWQVSGQADIDAKLTSVLGPNLIRKVDGQVHLRLRNGTLAEMPGFVKALTLLNLSTLLTNEDKNSPGLKFETMEGAFDIQDGVARTEKMIVLKSPSLKVGLVGKVDFVKQFINARILITVVSLPEDVIKKIPLVRRFKDGNQEGGVIPIWFSVKGPLRNPEVTREP